MRRVAIGGVFLAAIVLTSCGTSPREVVVPVRARETDAVDAFSVLRAAGFRVSLAGPVAVSSLVEPSTAYLTPHAGTHAPVGSTVTIHTDHGAIGSPAVLKSHPRYRVPSFTGRPLAAAVYWADAHSMFWSIPHLPSVRASDATHLFDAYRVVAQQPKPGGTIVQGVMVGGGFRPTPLTLTVVVR